MLSFAKRDNCSQCIIDVEEDGSSEFCYEDCFGFWGGEDGLVNSGDEAELDECGYCGGINNFTLGGIEAGITCNQGEINCFLPK